jgi:hypothetical protein
LKTKITVPIYSSFGESQTETPYEKLVDEIEIPLGVAKAENTNNG